MKRMRRSLWACGHWGNCGYLGYFGQLRAFELFVVVVLGFCLRSRRRDSFGYLGALQVSGGPSSSWLGFYPCSDGDSLWAFRSFSALLFGRGLLSETEKKGVLWALWAIGLSGSSFWSGTFVRGHDEEHSFCEQLWASGDMRGICAFHKIFVGLWVLESMGWICGCWVAVGFRPMYR
jgi:hypothetical protein